jgi:FlaA1/EpsC-like NDP-sugar epimerase
MNSISRFARGPKSGWKRSFVLRAGSKFSAGRLHVATVGFVLVDCLALVVAYLAAIRFLTTYTNTPIGVVSSVEFALLVVALKVIALWHFGAFRAPRRYAGLSEMLCVLYAILLSSVLLYIGVRATRAVPGLWVAVDAVMSGIGLVAVHFSARIYISERARRLSTAKKVVVIGAGDGAAQIVRELSRNPDSGIRPVALIDDDAAKTGMSICGVPVMGNLSRLRAVVEQTGAVEALICIPSASQAQITRIVAACRECEVCVRTLPSFRDLIGGKVSVRDLQAISVEVLLRRERILADSNLTKSLLSGKTVLVTGAGGSIGSELCLQIAAAGPRRLILLDKSENSLFYSHSAIAERFPGVDAKPCLADITDVERLRTIFRQEAPHLVFHAAAFKHVGMMQLHPQEAIRNNTVGTYHVAVAALQAGVERLVNISTDKAVNPHCYMGLSKKFAELAVKHLGQSNHARFLNVRFGNVAGSSGSVLRIFSEQIKNGGPIRVTDPQATRFFMSIPEAVYLILCAAARGKEGETYIFDMGEPINIYDMARTLSLLSGYSPEEELPIEFIGLRDGEKVHEELWEQWERPRATESPLLFALEGRNPAPLDIVSVMRSFEGYLRARDYEGLLCFIDELVPGFALSRIPRVEVTDYSSLGTVELPA